MNRITISVHAFGYVSGEDYEELEINQERKVEKETSRDGLTEKDCHIVLMDLIKAVKEIKLLYPHENSALENKLASIKFDIYYDSGTNQLDEEAFFNSAAPYNSLSDAILEYIKVTDNGDEGTRVWIPENDNYESHPAGTFAILSLVLRNKKWISDYIDFLGS